MCAPLWSSLQTGLPGRFFTAVWVSLGKRERIRLFSLTVKSMEGLDKKEESLLCAASFLLPCLLLLFADPVCKGPTVFESQPSTTKATMTWRDRKADPTATPTVFENQPKVSDFWSLPPLPNLHGLPSATERIVEETCTRRASLCCS